MTTLYNDPSEFTEDQLSGFVDLYADRLRAVPGGVISHREADPIVAVVVGGGSGHYPAFAGLVGPGFASGAVVGNVFTSPSAAQVYSVAKSADQGRGVILTFGNYAGDVMNFGIAAERLRSEGIDTRIVIVTDDVASSPVEEQRRGIAGDFTVFKALGAAAASGADIDEVERIGRATNAATRSFGVAFTGCTMPGAHEPLFTVPDSQMGVGLGIHGEPGIHDAPLTSAHELARMLVDGVLAERPRIETSRVAVIVNGLGTTKYEELFLLWNEIRLMLADEGLTAVEPEVGELVTSLDMGGVSLTITWLDDELEEAWRADAYTPAYRKTAAAISQLYAPDIAADADTNAQIPTPSEAGTELAALVTAGLTELARVLHTNEDELGRIDAVAGDGDHGRGMVKGADAAVHAVARLDGAGPEWLLKRAGRAWAAEAGGTSGVLWGAGLESAGSALEDSRPTYTANDAVDAIDAFVQAISDLGRADIGDKTLIDAAVPFQQKLRERVEAGDSLAAAWSSAASAAHAAAEATAELTPRKGRARPLAAKSVGTPDAGATSFALIVTALGAMSPVRELERNNHE
ncbi:dihydroxyacetone kinase family protein [Microbacterium sp. MPKO10]|uniref:dihydroxyacetone kinase family protein n=1 Tax=Microbacterium sp. MPKO10 TaxID=2989818 RepID=UPI0022366D4B|nr:dihydroxyacetone kinase family protein [Microbacterium sp. MPKO10]MCW4457723.1 dihydroxyacetone kinase family protein [Microbacterium sp. MPKO10]